MSTGRCEFGGDDTAASTRTNHDDVVFIRQTSEAYCRRARGLSGDDRIRSEPEHGPPDRLGGPP